MDLFLYGDPLFIQPSTSWGTLFLGPFKKSPGNEVALWAFNNLPAYNLSCPDGHRNFFLK